MTESILDGYKVDYIREHHKKARKLRTVSFGYHGTKKRAVVGDPIKKHPIRNTLATILTRRARTDG